MSGHSKWSTIKHKKGAADAKRGKLFTKLSRAIIVAAKEGGPDPAGEPRAPERDREGEVVLDAQGHDRARDRTGAGTDADAAAYETIVYEGYGPDGVARARRGADRQPQPHRLRRPAHVHQARRQPRRRPARSRGSSSGAASCSSTRDGVDEDELMLAAADGGADDVERDGDVFQVTSAPESAHRRARGDRGGRDRGRSRPS